MEFATLQLRDAVLCAAHVSWEADRCDLRIVPTGGAAHLLIFEGVTKLEFSNEKPWGASCFINAVCEAIPGEFEIELQSGDVLRVRASHWQYRAEALA